MMMAIDEAPRDHAMNRFLDSKIGLTMVAEAGSKSKVSFWRAAD
jgi:hypothetical protein